jgi:hypothetical protein
MSYYPDGNNHQVVNPTYTPPASTKSPVQVAYVCDGRACADGCNNPECRHTCDISHAKNFEYVGDGKYMEKKACKKLGKHSYEAKLLPVTGAPEMVRLGDYVGGLFDFDGKVYLKVDALDPPYNYVNILTGDMRELHPDILVTPLEIWRVDGGENE